MEFFEESVLIFSNFLKIQDNTGQILQIQDKFGNTGQFLKIQDIQDIQDTLDSLLVSLFELSLPLLFAYCLVRGLFLFTVFFLFLLPILRNRKRKKVY